RSADRFVASERRRRASCITGNLRPGKKWSLCSAPIEHDSLAGSTQIVHRDRDEGVFPLHILDVDLERSEIWRRKSSGKLHLRPKNCCVIDPAMQRLRLRVAPDAQHFGKEKI